MLKDQSVRNIPPSQKGSYGHYKLFVVKMDEYYFREKPRLTGRPGMLDKTWTKNLQKAQLFTLNEAIEFANAHPFKYLNVAMVKLVETK